MSISDSVHIPLESKKVEALESIADSLSGVAQELFEIKDLLTEIVRELPDGHKALSVSVSDKT